MKTKKIKNALSAGQYWEWRTTIAEMETAKQAARVAELELNLIQKDVELTMMRAQLFSKIKVESAKQSYEASIAEYNRFKGVLESDLGQSLSGKVIDDVTFEINNLPNSIDKQP